MNTHTGDEGREIEQKCGCFPFSNINSTFYDFSVGSALKEIEMHKAESLARDEKLALFVYIYIYIF